MKWFTNTWTTVAMMNGPPLPPTTPASCPSCTKPQTVMVVVSTGDGELRVTASSATWLVTNYVP